MLVIPSKRWYASTAFLCNSINHMKTKFILLGSVALIALGITFFAAWARITHQPYAAKALTIGMNTQYIGLAALAILLFLWLTSKRK